MKKNKVVNILLVSILIIGMQLPVIAATTGIVNVDTLRIRKEATTESGIVKLVSIGDELTITGEEGDWYKVKVDQITGYVRKDLLTVEGNVVTPDENEPDEKEPVEEPKTPTEEAPTEDIPTDQAPTEDIGAEDIPTEEVPDGNTSDANNTSVSEIKGNKISILKSEKRLTAGSIIQLPEEIEIKILPSANSTNIEKLQANTEVTVLEVINSWCRVETEGACGWVRIDQ